jgi:hypothetical protein
MFGDLWFPKFAPNRVETREGTFFVSTHKSAVPDDVASQDGCQPPFGSRISHQVRPKKPSISRLSLGLGRKGVY